MFNDITPATFHVLWSGPHIKWTENRWRPLRATWLRKTCAGPVGPWTSLQSKTEERTGRARSADLRRAPRSPKCNQEGSAAGTKEAGRPHDEALRWAAVRDQTSGVVSSGGDRSPLPGFVAIHCIHQQVGYQQKRRGGQSLFGHVHLDCLSAVSVQVQVPLGGKCWLIAEECCHCWVLEPWRKPPRVEEVLRRAAPTFRGLVVARWTSFQGPVCVSLITKCPLAPGVFDWH